MHRRDGYRCVVCGAYVSEDEKMHHEPCGIYKSDEIQKAVTLCNACHYNRHNGLQSAQIREICVDYLRGIYGTLGAKKE